MKLKTSMIFTHSHIKLIDYKHGKTIKCQHHFRYFYLSKKIKGVI
ncbi:hypothetical protein CNEO3_340027 [Clostridium neonatale]|nr:hypothetical protein CNEO_1550060 [Clostridium neonatale]CAI3621992.1 hypothetical protein CNEO3_340027 [Clostridium neonatale]CAI3687264.1 hypothetical protein CNEO4_680040 [Clostridium neonatale]